MTCEKARHVVSEVLGEVKNESAMASKAYVASMTVTELKQELKQRGLSTRGSKKNLRDRLERVRSLLRTVHVFYACSVTST